MNGSVPFLDQDNISKFCVEDIWRTVDEKALVLLEFHFHLIEICR